MTSAPQAFEWPRLCKLCKQPLQGPDGRCPEAECRGGGRTTRRVLTPRQFAEAERAYRGPHVWRGNEGEAPGFAALGAAGSMRVRPRERWAIYVLASARVGSPPWGVPERPYLRVSVWPWSGGELYVRLRDADDHYWEGPALPTAYAANEAVNRLVRAAPLTDEVLEALGYR